MADHAEAGFHAGAERSSGPRPRRSRGVSAEAWALPALTLAIIVFFSFLPSTSDTFPTAANFRAISSSQAVVAIATLAVLVPLICEEFDLSVGANVGLSSVMCASVMESGGPLALAIVVGIGVGALVGAVNGLLVTRARVSAVIVTLGVSVVIAGVIQAKTDGRTVVENISPDLIDVVGGRTAGIPNVLFILAVAAVALYYLLCHTPLGRHLYMLGDNRSAARLIGLPTDRLLLGAFVIAGTLAGVAGVTTVGVFGSADSDTGTTLLLPALAAAFLSAAAINPGRFNVGGALVAIAFLAALNGGLNLAGAPTYLADLINGSALIAGVALASWLGRRKGGDGAIAAALSRPMRKPYET